jgi:hypothetical protein
MTITTNTTGAASGWGIWRSPDRCPGCGREHVHSVHDGESTNFLCRSCHRCWNLSMGWVRQVEPDTCPGCEWRSVCSLRWD